MLWRFAGRVLLCYYNLCDGARARRYIYNGAPRQIPCICIAFGLIHHNPGNCAVVPFSFSLLYTALYTRCCAFLSPIKNSLFPRTARRKPSIYTLAHTHIHFAELLTFFLLSSLSLTPIYSSLIAHRFFLLLLFHCFFFLLLFFLHFCIIEK